MAEVTQTTEVEEDVHTAHHGDPFVPPERGVCLINDLHPELLSRIFEVGLAMASFPAAFEVDMKVGFTDLRREPHSIGYDDADAYGFLAEHYDLWPTEFRTLVSGVCSLWRSVALSTPSLWSKIVVFHYDRPPYEYVSWLLERSKDHAIDIYVYCHRSRVEIPSEADFRSLFDVLLPHVHRWRTMGLIVSDFHYLRSFFNAAFGPSIHPASRLTNLHLIYIKDLEGESGGRLYPSMSEPLPVFGSSVPLLTSLHLWRVHVDWNQPWTPSAANLTDLDLAFRVEDPRPSWAQFASILRSASSLEKLSLRRAGPSGDPSKWFIYPTDGSPTDLNAPIQLPRVTDFLLAFYTPAHAIGLIRKLYLPALKNLVLDLDDGDYTDFVHELAGPATSLSPSKGPMHSRLSRLESLRIDRLRCREGCTSVLYSGLQNLTLLNISLRHFHATSLDMLVVSCTPSRCGDVWMPRLETLYVSFAPRDVLRAVVRTRKEAGMPLRSLYLQSSEKDLEELNWLKENVETVGFVWSDNDEPSA